MEYVKAKENPIAINESLMGKILKKTPDIANLSYKAYNPKIVDIKNKKVIKGKDAKQMIEDIDKGNFINTNMSVYDDPNKKQDKDHLKDMAKDAKTVSYKEVKPPKIKKNEKTALVPVKR